MLKIGIFGVGHLGKIHINCIHQLTDVYNLVGFYDPDDVQAQAVSEKYGLLRFDDPTTLLKAVDVADIVAPTSAHYELARLALQYHKHVFIEKPLTQTLVEAKALILLQKKHPVGA